MMQDIILKHKFSVRFVNIHVPLAVVTQIATLVYQQLIELSLVLSAYVILDFMMMDFVRIVHFLVWLVIHNKIARYAFLII